MEYLFGQKGQESDLLDLANLVFSMVRRPVDFKRLLPKVYARDDFAPLHALAMENGRIKGTLGLLPGTLRVGDAGTLKTGYLGTMAVHPYARGGGLMRTLMDMMIRRGVETGLDLMALDGRRHRYNYFGFERGGAVTTFLLNDDSFRHGFSAVDDSAIEMISAEDAEPGDLEAARRASLALLMAGEREDLLPVLKSWEAEPYFVRAAGRALGYLCVQGNTVTETALPEDDVLPALKALLRKRKGLETCVAVSPCAIGLLERLRAVSENVHLADGMMLRVLNWPKTLQTLLLFRRSIAPITDGAVVLDIEGAGRLRLSVKGEDVSVETTDEAPTARWSHNEAVTRLFSPLALMLPGPVPPSWLPLPLYIPRPDAF